jgi:hypothetical protein
VTPDGTLNVPDDVNDSTAGANTVIEKARDDVFDAASTALKTKFDVVSPPTAEKPEI